MFDPTFDEGINLRLCEHNLIEENSAVIQPIDTTHLLLFRAQIIVTQTSSIKLFVSRQSSCTWEELGTRGKRSACFQIFSPYFGH